MRTTCRTTIDSLTVLAFRINMAWEEGEEATALGLRKFREVGFYLVDVKSQLKHGQWLPWLKRNVRFCEREGRRYMALSECKSDTVSDLKKKWQEITGRDANSGNKQAYSVEWYIVVQAFRLWTYRRAPRAMKAYRARRRPALAAPESWTLIDLLRAARAFAGVITGAFREVHPTLYPNGPIRLTSDWLLAGGWPKAPTPHRRTEHRNRVAGRRRKPPR
jgi:hypothetical protein